MDDWNAVHAHMEQCSVTERKGMLISAGVWVNLESTLLSERSQTQTVTLYDPTYMGHSEQTKPLGQGAG